MLELNASCFAVKAVTMFVPFTTSEPGIVTTPSRSTESLLSATVALADGALSESLFRQMWNLDLL